VTQRGLSSFSALILAAAIISVACSREEPTALSGDAADYGQVALEFARSLAAREYPKAYAMMSEGYRQSRTVDELRIGFEAIVPTDWGAIGPIEVGQTMTSWPGKQPSDVGWAFVSIGGDVYSEAITVIVTSENGKARIREVEFGRP
jgi:hypothetical protein